MIQLRRGFFFSPFWVIFLLTLPKQVSPKKSLLLLFRFLFPPPFWDENLVLCRELNALKHEFGTKEGSEKSQLWTQEQSVCPGVPCMCLAWGTHSRLILAQHVSVDISSLYHYHGRYHATKPWRMCPCDGRHGIAQHPLSTVQLSPWCPGKMLELPIGPLWNSPPYSG